MLNDFNSANMERMQATARAIAIDTTGTITTA